MHAKAHLPKRTEHKELLTTRSPVVRPLGSYHAVQRGSDELWCTSQTVQQPQNDWVEQDAGVQVGPAMQALNPKYVL
jgi:hypothetical protein